MVSPAYLTDHLPDRPGRPADDADRALSENLIGAYARSMRTITATRASRGFSELIDAVERGETFAITRAGHVVAEIRPAAATTGRALRAALGGLPPLDDAFERDVAAATALLATEADDPWHVD